MKTIPSFAGQVVFDEITQDWELTVNGEILGYAPDEAAGWERVNAHILDQTKWHYRVAGEAAARAAIGRIEQLASAPSAQPRPAGRQQLPATSREIAEAIGYARLASSDERTIKALNKAFEELMIPFNFQWDGRRLITSSRSKPKDRHYVTADTCDCDSFVKGKGKPCWHRLAYIVLSIISQPEPAPARRLPMARPQFAQV